MGRGERDRPRVRRSARRHARVRRRRWPAIDVRRRRRGRAVATGRRSRARSTAPVVRRRSRDVIGRCNAAARCRWRRRDAVHADRIRDRPFHVGVTMRWLILILAACSNAADLVVDAPFKPVDAAADAAHTDAPEALRILVVNEIASGDTPDWFEIVNATAAPVQLDQFVYVDVAGDFAKAKPFPTLT